MAQPLEDKEMEIIDRAAAPPARSEHREIPFLPWPRRVRAMLAGETVADSSRVRLLLEPGRLPVYYFPAEDVRRDLLVASGTTSDAPSKGVATHWHVKVGDRVSSDAAWEYREPTDYAAALAGHIAFYWDRLDAWYEEDDEVFVHPRDPYHRVDVVSSSRHVRVEVDGVTVADTHRPRLLFETGLPTRYYIPKLDVRLDVLERSDSVTSCPYKGTASYFHVRVGDRLHDDLLWVYESPIPECPKIENLLSFFNERADIFVDGELQEKPKTPWSR